MGSGERDEEEGGGRGMKGREVGEEGWGGQGGGEKDSSVSLTWQVYQTSQWGETWRWRPRGRRCTSRDRAGDNMGGGFWWVLACVRKGSSQVE